jgi:hypothetical protein
MVTGLEGREEEWAEAGARREVLKVLVAAHG